MICHCLYEVHALSINYPTKVNNFTTNKFINIMEKRNLIHLWSIRLFSTLVLSCILASLSATTYNYYEEAKENIDLTGFWKGRTRSLSPPIQASIDGESLFLENQQPTCDIEISIVNNQGVIVYSESISATETVFIIIPITELQAGTYLLELRNPSNGYLKGNFMIP